MLKRRDLTNGTVSKALLIVAIPTMMSQLLMFSYNIVDMKFVSNLGDYAVAAVGSAALFVTIGVVLNSLAIIGTGIKASQAVGKEDRGLFHKAVNVGYVISITLSIIYIIVTLFFSEELISILKLDDEIVRVEAIKYLQIFGFVSLFNCLNQLYMRILSGLGLTDKNLIISAIGLTLNVILDPILIKTHGVSGAAIASLIANIIMSMLFIILYKNEVKYTLKVKFTRNEVYETIRYGFPYMVQRSIFTFISISIGAMIAKYGTEVISAHKIGYQIESVTFMVIGGMLAAMSSFAGQNFGAKQYDRIKYGYTVATRIGFAYALFTSTIFMLFGEHIVGIFSDTPETIYYSYMYLRIIAVAQIFAVFEMIGNGLYTGIGKPQIPAIISISITVLRIPIALILEVKYGINGIFMAIAVTSMLKGGVSYGIYKFKISREIGFKIIST